MPRKSAHQIALEAENAKLRAQLNGLRSETVEAPGIREVESRPKLSGTVTVACKIPMGLQLQLQHAMETRIPNGHTGGSDGYTLTKSMVFGGPKYFVFGPSMPANGGRPDNYILPDKLEGGYALTHGIPAGFWAEWVEQNGMSAFVENRMVFAMDQASVVSKAREQAELKSGLEPLSRDTDVRGRLVDARLPKPASSALTRVGFDNRDATGLE